jgi:hypothetical protein
MKLRLTILMCLLMTTVALVTGRSESRTTTTAPAQLEMRCGWFSNPTPGNVWLYDRDGEWTIEVQGGYRVEDDWEWPNFAPGQCVKTNVNYGYGCACLRMRVDKETNRVLEIKASRSRPLSVCRQDTALRKCKGSK